MITRAATVGGINVHVTSLAAEQRVGLEVRPHRSTVIRFDGSPAQARTLADYLRRAADEAEE